MIGDMVESIHHIGSTSIVGFCARPKIDIHAGRAAMRCLLKQRARDDYTFLAIPNDDGSWPSPRGTTPMARGYLCRLKRFLFSDWLRAYQVASFFVWCRGGRG